MAKTINMQNLVTHITNGTFEHKYCKICLLPLDDLFENVFTTVCKEASQYCVADVLVEMCQMKVSPDDNFKICPKCFTSALEAYKFFILTKRSEEILNHCIDGLYNQIEFINLPENLTTESLCITLPAFSSNFDFDIDISQFPFQNLETIDIQTIKSVSNISHDHLLLKKEISDVESDVEENLVIVMNEDDEPKFFKPQKNGNITLVKNNDISYEIKEKKTRKRIRMKYKTCTRCPVKYRFVGKLKDHMKQEHGLDIFVCRVCQEPIEDEQEFKNHLQTHTGVHTCTICNLIFKKKDNILGHFKWHAKMKDLGELENANICEICGLMFETEEFLKEHHEKKHVNRYTCFYCGKMYKGELSFERHIKKHEMNKDNGKKEKTTILKKTSYICETCGKNFVDERALLWHERLHKDERPYICDVCGRAFVSVNRRNQHALCAHTAPSRRCPLCPALFHLRSMVNTHIKKVHLKTHKRRNRTVKRQNVFWKTETVPIQELSVSLQNEILELQAAQKDTAQTNHM